MTLDLRLRGVADADLPVFFVQQLDPVANAMAGMSPRSREAFDAHWAKIRADATVVLRTIEIRGERGDGGFQAGAEAGGHVAGNVLAFDRGGMRQVGYWIGRDWWGRGIASRALAAFVAEVRDRPLHGVVEKHNGASLRVLEKCGFVATGELEEPGAGGERVVLVVLRLDA